MKSLHSYLSVEKGFLPALPSTFLPLGYSPKCQNFKFLEGRAEKEEGDIQYKGTGDTPLLGVLLVLEDFINSSGVMKSLAITTTHFYALNTTTSAYDDYTPVAGLTGVEDSPYSTAFYRNFYVYTNGRDAIMKWLSTAAASIALAGATPYLAWDLMMMADRLCLINFSEGTDYHPLGWRWSDVADIETYTAGNYIDLETACKGSSKIWKALKMGQFACVYGDKSIGIVEYTGVATAPFSSRTGVAGTGIIGKRCVIDVNGTHFLFDGNNIYSYDGGTFVTPFGDAIQTFLLNDINKQCQSMSYFSWHSKSQTLYFRYPSLLSTTPDSFVAYNFSNQTWSYGKRTYTCCGEVQDVTATLWSSLTMAWSALTTSWGGLNSYKKKMVYGDGSGKVWEYGNLYTHKGVAIDAFYDTFDFTIKDSGYKRVGLKADSLNFEAKGDSVDVYYSVDEGNTYTLLDTFTFTNSWMPYRVDFEVVSEVIRFRFQNNQLANNKCSIRHVDIGHKPQGDRGRG